ncbi:MAG: hypothetical protein WBD30_01320 [Bacteroidota bacterium]
MERIRICVLSLLLVQGLQPCYPQGSAGSSGDVEPRFLVDAPIAGMIRGGAIAFDADFYQQGGVLLGISVGVFYRLALGITYGGSNLIGSGEPIMNPVPGVQVRLRVVEESLLLPALALGFDSQGRDGYIRDLDRYVIKSPGLYGVLSKNYGVWGFLSIHGGVNYTFERTDEDRDINFYCGIEKTIGPTVSVVLEYNLAANDNEEQAVGQGSGYLNAALRWSFAEGLTLSVNLKDLTRNSTAVDGVNRSVRLEYVTTL